MLNPLPQCLLARVDPLDLFHLEGQYLLFVPEGQAFQRHLYLPKCVNKFKK